MSIIIKEINMEFCCEQMRINVEHKCKTHKNPFDCPDNLIYYSPNKVYGLIVHDGSSSYVIIDYCPFCGKKL
jgi:hypothetical protein